MAAQSTTPENRVPENRVPLWIVERRGLEEPFTTLFSDGINALRYSRQIRTPDISYQVKTGHLTIQNMTEPRHSAESGSTVYTIFHSIYDSDLNYFGEWSNLRWVEDKKSAIDWFANWLNEVDELALHSHINFLERTPEKYKYTEGTCVVKAWIAEVVVDEKVPEIRQLPGNPPRPGSPFTF
ncbi:hypothetical protein BU24DRAFT_415286 [Aaosphaeria arxii CBS 175.79]|uniref:Uncharacterized protein n=1 Tax=Aaosphaeria arxii CBS 175.79 TaxID=1450172 RepID=A0A6A5X7L7_9PLEO|nr:uncharacterized protein BU24DRAFT_415286 [Aaosphaeria arxii CBS 175.79]KAF2008922.1 hypothetical protein BU24DRAFT_415286 [Aaosphaeria arxii CBS 175.79]